MQLDIKVKTGKKENNVIKKDFAKYEVWVRSRPVKGAANREMIEVMADYFNVKKHQLRIVRGLISQNKIIELSE